MNIKSIKIPYNLVLVKLDKDHEEYHNTENGNKTGISVAPWGINAASHLAVTGLVVQLPDSLIYNGYVLKSLKRDKMRNDADQKEIARLRHESMAYDVPNELAIGMRVYFEYLTRLDALKEGRFIEDETGYYLLIPYDRLVMTFRDTTNFDDVQINDVYMLNGFVLIKPLEYATEKGADGIKGIKTENDLFIPESKSRYVKRGNTWFANVLVGGCPVKSYADFPNTGGDDMTVGRPGQKISYDGRQQKRLEVEHHRVIFKKHTLYRIHRKDIVALYTDGKII